MSSTSMRIMDSLYEANVSSFNAFNDKGITLGKKRAISKAIAFEQLKQFTDFPFVSSARLHRVHFRNDWKTVDLTFTIFHEDGGPSWIDVNDPMLTVTYDFNDSEDMDHLLQGDRHFQRAFLSFLACQLIVPISLFESEHLRDFNVTEFKDSLRNLTVTADSPVKGDKVTDNIEWNLRNLLESENVAVDIFESIKFIAWNDRMNLLRVLKKEAPYSRWADQVNPQFVMQPPLPYSTKNRVPRNIINDDTRCLVSFSWGKESLLTAHIAEQCSDHVVYGSIRHRYNKDDSAYSYQDDYSTFRKGTVYEDRQDQFLDCRSGYLSLIYHLIPLAPGVTHVMHHIYGMCHVINSWHRADLILLGDEMERNFANPLFFAEDRRTGKRELLLASEIEPWKRDPRMSLHNAGYDYTFDFHQSEFMHAILNEKLLSSNKAISSVLYDLPEIAIQYILGEVSPEKFSYQASCWYADDTKKTNGGKWCGQCEKCHRLAWVMDSLGMDYKKLGLSLVNPTSYLEPHERNGNRLFAISADPMVSDGRAYSVCDAAFKFMALKLIHDSDLDVSTNDFPGLHNDHVSRGMIVKELGVGTINRDAYRGAELSDVQSAINRFEATIENASFMHLGNVKPPPPALTNVGTNKD